MAELPTLINLANLQNETTAVNAINSNSSAIGTAFLDVLSRSGTSPNQMATILDMNSNRIINLPAPIGATEPLRLTDANTLNGGGTIQPIPAGGTLGQVLAKLSASSYDVGWISNQVRERLSADRTYFVNVGSGNDNNNGLTSGTAFKTIQRAVTVIGANLDLAGFSCTIQLADGTYPENVVFTPYLGRAGQGHSGPVLIKGNVITPANVIIQPISGTAFAAIENSLLEWELQGMTIISSGSNGVGVLADVGGWVVLKDHIVFGACTLQHAIAQNEGVVEFTDDYTISGNAAVHMYSVNGGKVLYTGGQTVTLTGIPAFSSFFAFSGVGSLISIPSVTYSGAATGSRWNTVDRGIIWTNGAALDSLLPGNSNGTATLLTLAEGVASGSVVTSAGINTNPIWSASPTLTTSLTAPLIAGGAGATSTLTLESTSGAGTTDAIIFKVASQSEAMRIKTGKTVGIGDNSPVNKLVVSNNITQGIAAINGGNTVMQVIGADGTQAGIEFAGYGTSSYPQLVMRTARGTAASPTAIQTNDFIYVLQGYSYDGSTYGQNVLVAGQASEIQSAGHHGAYLAIYTTPTSSTSITEAVRIQNSGGLSVGTATDLGIGTVLANGAIKTLSTTASSSATTGSGIFGGGIGVSGDVWASGNHSVSTATKTLLLKQGANGCVGTFVCNGATPVTITNSNVAITDAIIISLNTVGGTVGGTAKVPPMVTAITGSTSFVTTGQATDTSTYNYAIIKNAA